MIEPYQALGLVPTMRGIRHRDEISTNLEHLSHLIKAASWLSSLDLPVRLIAVPERGVDAHVQQPAPKLREPFRIGGVDDQVAH